MSVNFGLPYSLIMSYKNNIDDIKAIANANDSFCVSCIMTAGSSPLHLFRTFYRFSGWNVSLSEQVDTLNIFDGFVDLVLLLCLDDIAKKYNEVEELKTYIDQCYKKLLIIYDNSSERIQQKCYIYNPDSDSIEPDVYLKIIYIIVYCSYIYSTCYKPIIDLYARSSSTRSFRPKEHTVFENNPLEPLKCLLKYIVLNDFSINNDFKAIDKIMEFIGKLSDVYNILISKLPKRTKMIKDIKDRIELSKNAYNVYKYYIMSNKYQTVSNILTDFDTFDVIYKIIINFKVKMYPIKENLLYCDDYYNKDNKKLAPAIDDCKLLIDELMSNTDINNNELQEKFNLFISSAITKTDESILNVVPIKRDIQFLVIVDNYPALSDMSPSSNYFKFLNKLFCAFNERIRKYIIPPFKFNMEILLAKENISLMGNRNVLMTYASTKWFYMADDDDSPPSISWLSKAIDIVSKEWNEKQEIPKFVQQNGEWFKNGLCFTIRRTYDTYGGNNFFDNIDNRSMCLAFWSLLFNRVAFLLNNNFVEPYFMSGEDAAFHTHTVYSNPYKRFNKTSIMWYAKAYGYFKLSVEISKHLKDGYYIYSGQSFTGYDYEFLSSLNYYIQSDTYNAIMGPGEKEHDENDINIYQRLIEYNDYVYGDEKRNKAHVLDGLKNVNHPDKVVETKIYVPSNDEFAWIKDEKFFITTRTYRKKNIDEITDIGEWNENLKKDENSLKLYGGNRVVLLFVLLCLTILIIALLIKIIKTLNLIKLIPPFINHH